MANGAGFVVHKSSAYRKRWWEIKSSTQSIVVWALSFCSLFATLDFDKAYQVAKRNHEMKSWLEVFR